MTDESEVSCYLCLQADEYGSMLKVSIIPPGFAPRSPLVICRSCGAEVARELWSVLEGENSPTAIGQQGGADSADVPPLPSAVTDLESSENPPTREADPTESSAKQDSE